MGDSEDTLHSRTQDALEELEDWVKANPGEDAHDTINEITDSACPIYYSTILRFAAENITLATDEPELGPAFDGSPTPVNIIAANIYEHIHEALYERWQEMQQEMEDDD